jgi:DNA-binding transcriptional ArsR family regulator
MTADERSRIELRDPGAMRAMAHPTRLRLLGELRARGPQSVGLLCASVGEAAGSVSYHLGVLAKHGLVLEAPEHARDRRERWWRAAHDLTSWDTAEGLADPALRDALGELRASVLQRYAEQLRDYLRREPSLPAEWVRAATSGDELLHLTSDGLAQLTSELHALLQRWAGRSDPDADGAEPVTVIVHAFRR